MLVPCTTQFDWIYLSTDRSHRSILVHCGAQAVFWDPDHPSNLWHEFNILLDIHSFLGHILCANPFVTGDAIRAYLQLLKKLPNRRTLME